MVSTAIDNAFPDKPETGAIPHSEIRTPHSDYAAFARALVATGIISDPWVEGEERFRLEPVILEPERYEAFREAIESVGQVYHEMTEILRRDPDLIGQNFHLTPWQRLMWDASEGYWHGIARADTFVLPDGSIRICELNADTPSGEPEAVVLNTLRRAFHPDLVDPNSEFEERFIEVVFSSYRAVTGDDGGTPRAVGIIYPTDLPEDLSMIALYRSWFERRGIPFVLASPYNISRSKDGHLLLFGRPVDAIVRHYKTDWWSEREPACVDGEAFLDPDPLDRPLLDLLRAESEGKVAIVNPFGAVIAQNKLSMAFFWKHIELFSAESQRAIRAYIPPTFRLSEIDREAVGRARERWVMKSDYGCEGDEVLIGRDASQEEWDRLLGNAIPERWIVQEFFEAETDADGMVANHGLFLIGGRFGGIFTRFSSRSTDYRALTPPTFVRKSG